MDAYIVCPNKFPKDAPVALKGFIRKPDVNNVTQLERFIEKHCCVTDGGRYEHIDTTRDGWIVFERTRFVQSPQGARKAARELASAIRDYFPHIEKISIH